MKTLKDLLEDPNTTKEDFINLINQLPSNIQDFDTDTTIGAFWGIDDVIFRAEEIGFTLDYIQAKEVLGNTKRNHDASIGINWDVLDCHIEDFAYSAGLVRLDSWDDWDDIVIEKVP